MRLPSVESSLRSAFSLRLRCLSTPAASSMKPRRSSGVACRIVSSWPWPTMTCISRPMPESLSSSCTSSSRQAVAVDGVLGAAVAEHRARDRDLGVLDRQRTVAVVDRQLHLGAAERRTAGRAGEDDVLHLAAAQRLGALLAHHPGERVDDVGLAGAVGPDDAGDPGLELERRGRRKGLEALQREALEIQRAAPLRGRWTTIAASSQTPGKDAHPNRPAGRRSADLRSEDRAGVEDARPGRGRP